MPFVPEIELLPSATPLQPQPIAQSVALHQQDQSQRQDEHRPHSQQQQPSPASPVSTQTRFLVSPPSSSTSAARDRASPTRPSNPAGLGPPDLVAASPAAAAAGRPRSHRAERLIALSTAPPLS